VNPAITKRRLHSGRNERAASPTRRVTEAKSEWWNPYHIMGVAVVLGPALLCAIHGAPVEQEQSGSGRVRAASTPAPAPLGCTSAAPHSASADSAGRAAAASAPRTAAPAASGASRPSSAQAPALPPPPGARTCGGAQGQPAVSHTAAGTPLSAQHRMQAKELSESLRAGAAPHPRAPRRRCRPALRPARAAARRRTVVIAHATCEASLGPCTAKAPEGSSRQGRRGCSKNSTPTRSEPEAHPRESHQNGSSTARLEAGTGAPLRHQRARYGARAAADQRGQPARAAGGG